MFSNHKGVKTIFKAIFVCLLMILPLSISTSIMASQEPDVGIVPHLLNHDAISLSNESPLTSPAKTILSQATTSNSNSNAISANKHEAMMTASSQSIMFIENMGQFAKEARFQVRGASHTLWLAEDGLWISMLEEVEAATPQRAVNIKLSFVGANRNPRIEPFNRLETYSNYFQGNDSSQWHSEVPTWGGVRYLDIYPGIDLEITSQNGQLVQRIVADEQADLNAVRLQAEGADKLALHNDQLRLTTAIGDVAWPLLQLVTNHNSSTTLQTEELGQAEVNSNYIIAPFTSNSTATGSALTQQARLRKNGTLNYSALIGSSRDDLAYEVKLDSSGNSVVTGRTSSPNFPVTPGVDDTTHNGNSDLFVLKLSSDGQQLLYSTFIGGKSYDEGRDLVVDQNNNIIVVGSTSSSNFPTTNFAYDKSYSGGNDVILLKLNSNGTDLLYSTFIGDVLNDYGYSVALDNSQNIVITGRTESANFPTMNAYDSSHNGEDDIFVLKLNLNNNSRDLLYSTFVGGNDHDGRHLSVKIDNSGNALVTGQTDSGNFPTTGNSYDNTPNGGSDAFLFKLSNDGSDLLYSTFIGGSAYEYGNDLEFDANGNILIVGLTNSEDFPTTKGSYDTTHNGEQDVFVLKLKLEADGSELLYSTFLGGSNDDLGADLALNENGEVFVSGSTSSADFPTTDDAYDTTHHGSSDIFVGKLASDGESLLYSTFIGGNNDDKSDHGLEIDGDDNLIVVGETISRDFPTKGSYGTTHNGGKDIFIFSLKPNVTPPPTPTPTLTSTPTPAPPAKVRIEPVIQVNGENVVPTADTSITVIYDKLESTHQPRIRWIRKYKLEQQEDPDFNDQVTVDAENTIVEEEWCVSVAPFDGVTYGEPEESCAYIEVVPNQLPEAEVEIPEFPSDDDPLTVTIQITDTDGVANAKDAQVRWYRDDLLQSAFNDTSQIDPSKTIVGDVWCAVARANDGLEFGGVSEKKCTIINPPEGALPFITNARINPSEAIENEDLTVEYTYNDPDILHRGVQSVEIRWFRNGKLQPQLNNAIKVADQFTLPGETWWATVQPSLLNSSWPYGRLAQTEAIDIAAETINTAPEASNLIINPQKPTIDDDLRLTYNFTDVDHDLQGKTIIEWYRDLQYVQQYDGVRVIPAQETEVGEVWHAIIIPHDRQVYGDRVAARSVKIALPSTPSNSLPQVSNVYLSPGIPDVDENLDLYYTYHDNDPYDQEGDTLIEWSRDGQKVSLYQGETVIPSQLTRVGQEWCAEVTPHDGKGFGTLVKSGCVTIVPDGRNTEPTVSKVHILPSTPRSGDDLVVDYTYFDADGHLETNTRINWYLNGKPFNKSGFENVTAIPSEYTLPNQLWQVEVQVNDGRQYSQPIASSLIIINTRPEVRNAEIIALEPSLENGLRLDYEYYDKDKHPEGRAAIKWYKNSIYQRHLDYQTSVPATELAWEQRWFATIETFDEHEYSHMLTTAEVTLARLFLPLILAQEVSPPTPKPPTPEPPTKTPTPPPTHYEENNTQATAYGPLEFGQNYDAYPEDENDWYYVVLHETSSLEVILDNYQEIRDKGQLVIYETFTNRAANTVDRVLIANDGGASSIRKVPNNGKPGALTNLAPGHYLIRVYTEERHHKNNLYRLKVDRR